MEINIAGVVLILRCSIVSQQNVTPINNHGLKIPKQPKL